MVTATRARSTTRSTAKPAKILDYVVLWMTPGNDCQEWTTHQCPHEALTECAKLDDILTRLGYGDASTLVEVMHRPTD